MPMLEDHYIAWLDVETTCLDPERGALLEVAVQITTRQGEPVRDFHAVLEHPSKFPRESAVANARECWGILRDAGSVTNPQGQELWVTEGMLKAGALSGHSVRQWLTWCRAQPFAREEGRSRVAKKQARWWVFELDPVAEHLACDTSSVTPYPSVPPSVTGV